MLPEVTARLDADVAGFIDAWDRAADAAVRNAARIRAAIASLPEVTRIRVEVDIDNDQLRGLGGELDRLTRNARAAGDAMRDFGNQARQSGEGVRELGENSRQAGDDVNHLGERARRAGDALGGLGRGGRMGGMHMKVLVAAITLLLSILPAIAAAALAAGAALQGLMVAGAVVAGGWKGISQAGERLKATLGGLQKQLESVFRSGLSREFQQLGTAISGLDGPLKGIAQSVVGVVKEFTGWIRSAQGMAEIETMLGGVDNMVKSLAPGVKAVAQLFTGWGEAAAPAMDDIGKAISSVFENLKKVIDKGKETGQLEKAFQAGASAIEAFGEVLAGVIDILIEMAAAGGEPAADAIKKFGQSLQDAAPAIGTLFGYLAQAVNILMTVVGWFAKLAKALEPLYRTINQVNDGVTEFMKVISPEKVKEFGAAIAGLGKAILDMADKATKAVKEWWKKTTQDIKTGVAKAVQAVKEWWTKQTQEIKTGVAKMLQAIKDWWNKTVQEYKTGAAKVIQAVKDWWTKKTQEVKTGVAKVIQAIKDWWNQTVQAVKDGIQKVIDEVKAWWDKVVEDVEAGAQKVVDEVKRMAEKVVDALAPWIKDMKDAGKDAGDGLDEGLASAASKVAATAKAIAQRAMNAIKSTLGIRSPSTVFRDEVGAMIPAGIADGIIAHSGLVTDAMRRAGLASVAAGGAAFGGANLGRGGRAGQQVLTLHIAGGADTAVGTMIARLAQQGKLKITANAVIGGRTP